MIQQSSPIEQEAREFAEKEEYTPAEVHAFVAGSQWQAKQVEQPAKNEPTPVKGDAVEFAKWKDKNVRATQNGDTYNQWYKDKKYSYEELYEIFSGKAAPKGDDVKSAKDSVAVSRGYPNWLEMENWLIDHNSPATVALLLVSAMEDVASQFAAPQAVKWVQASERLPEVLKNDEGDYCKYVQCANGQTVYIAPCAYQPNSKTWYMYGDYLTNKTTVTHWMPLPLPPNEVEGSTDKNET